MNDGDPEYVRHLEESLKKFMEPVHGIPLGVVVRALTGNVAIPWKEDDLHCAALKGPLSDGIREATRLIGREGLEANRPNEVGNYIEDPVASALAARGFKAQVPASREGRRQASGYPDLLVTMDPHPPIYLEVKTYNAASVNTTFRAFYLSPPLPKVSRDAYHLLVGFEIEKRGSRFFPIRFRLHAIEGLLLDVKHEFNTSNQVLYSTCPIIAEGSA